MMGHGHLMNNPSPLNQEGEVDQEAWHKQFRISLLVVAAPPTFTSILTAQFLSD